MFLADSWKDFEVLYAGEQEKYERWGNVYLRRPDPQAVWPVFCDGKASTWDDVPKPDALYVRSNTGGGAWQKLKSMPNNWTIGYNTLGKELKFIIEPTSFKHTGLFPEQLLLSEWSFFVPGCGAVGPVALQGASTPLRECYGSVLYADVS